MNKRLIFPTTLLLAALLACSIQDAVPSGDDISAAATAAAQTIAAGLGTLAPDDGGEAATATITPTSTDTLVPSVTPICDQAAFVSETVPDGTVFAPNAAFIKTWRLRNTGACTWTTSYAVVFQSGAAMSAPAAVPLLGNVPPGAEVDLAVNMQAPAAAGSHTGYWKMRNGAGVLFGLGPTNGSFLVMINVVPPTPTFTPTWSGPLVDLPLVPLFPFFFPSTQQVYAQVTAPGGDIGHATIACPSGTVVTGGGFAADSDLKVYNSSRDSNGWQVYAENPTGSGKLLNAYAICLSNTSGTSQQVVDQVTASAGGIGHATASCPGGSVVTGGGYAADGDLIVYNTSRSGNGWQVYAENPTGSGKLLNAYAVCLSGTSGTSQQVLAQVTASAGGIGHASAACPSGTVLTGGGYAATSILSVYNSSASSGNAGWEVYAENASGSGQLLNGYAICTTFP
jgi:hypothetical protein